MGGLLWALFIGLGGLPYSQLIQILGSGTRTALWLAFAQAAAVVWQTVTGSAPLTLANAAAKAIKSLTQYGLCTQSTTPTPSAPVDIMCNNGALRMVDDELPAAYKRVLGFQCNNNAMWQITGFKMRGSDTLRFSFKCTMTTPACNVLGAYDGTSAETNYSLYIGSTSSAKYLRYNGSSYRSDADSNEQYDVVITPTGSSGMKTDSTWTAKTFESTNDLCIGTTSLTATSSKLVGEIIGEIIVDGRLRLIPCERVSDGVLGYYDLVEESFYEPYTGFAGAVSLGYDGSHYELDTVGTPETLTVSATGAETQTVTDIPTLLSVGDCADTVDIISGGVARKCGIHIFDGNESISFIANMFYYQEGLRLQGSQRIMCSHFPYKNTIVSGDFVSTASSDSRNIIFSYGAATSVAEFKDFLRTQYAAGIPVIVIYPLAEETEETVTPHPLTTAVGTNTLSWNYPGSTKTVEYAYQEPTNKVGTAKVGTAKAG